MARFSLRKGDMGEEQMMIIVVLIIAVIGGAFLLTSSGNMFSWSSGKLSQFCIDNPDICGDIQKYDDYTITKNSVDMLTVAIKMVLSGGRDDAEYNKYLNGGKPLDISGMAAAADTKSPYRNPEISCEEVGVICTLESYTYNSRRYTPTEYEREQLNIDNVEAKNREEAEEKIKEEMKAESVSLICEPKIECTVKDFLLPENFRGIEGDFKEYIEGFGDPSYLVYYQVFPPGEARDWEGLVAWSESSRGALFAASCILGAIPVAKSGVKTTFKLAGKSLKEGTETLLRKMLSKKLKREMEEEVVKEMIEKVSKRAVAKQATMRAATMLGITYGSAYFAARLDSDMEKYEKLYPNSMVIKSPFKEIEYLPISFISPAVVEGDTIEMGMPVVLEKKGFVNQPTNFYLASPCRADLTISSKPVNCKLYSYEYGEKDENIQMNGHITYCEGADDRKDIREGKTCDSLPTSINEDIIDYSLFILKKMINEPAKYIIYEEEKDFQNEYDKDDKKRMKISIPMDEIELYYNVDGDVIDGFSWNYGSGKKTVSINDNIRVMKENNNLEKVVLKKEIEIEPDIPSISSDVPPVAFLLDPKGVQRTCLETEREPYGFNCEDVIYEEEYIENMADYQKYALRALSIDSGTKIHICYLPYMLIEHTDGMLDREYTSSYALYWKYDDDDEMVFESVKITKSGPGISLYKGTTVTVLSDFDHNGIIDKVNHFTYRWEENFAEEDNFYVKDYRIFSDNNYDEKFESLTANDCDIQGIVIEPDKDPYEEEKYNYCYGANKQGISIAITVLEIGGSAVLSVAGGPVGYLGSLLLNCGAATIENFTDWTTTAWPKG